jgi:MFS superfamily sulfate permease-like transporter
VLVLTVTGLLRWLTRHIPVPVVKGIQLGAGLSLVIAAGTTLLRPLEWVEPPFDNRLWALLVFMVLLATQRLPRFPYAFVVVTLGVSCSFLIITFHDHHHYPHLPYFAGWSPRAHLPAFLSHEAIGLALAQLPLTTLNSIIASSALAIELFASPTALPVDAPSVTALGLSVAGMNLVGCWFGCMPTCHGAGGLSAQYRFGARSGTSVIILGLLKMALGLAFGESLMGLLDTFPKSILGILVLAAGLELAKVGSSVNEGASDLWENSAESRGALDSRRHLSEEEAGERWTVMLITAAGILAFSNDAVGFAAGMLCHWALGLSRLVERRYQTPSGDEEHAPLLR